MSTQKLHFIRKFYQNGQIIRERYINDAELMDILTELNSICPCNLNIQIHGLALKSRFLN
jgi:hypothetical protein